MSGRLLLIVLFAATTGAGPLSGEETLRVMSFNIRYGTAQDGEDHWDKRREQVVTTIADFHPDLLGTQETLLFQAEYLQEQLKRFTYFGRSRMKTPDEHCGIFYNTTRFTWLAGGHFWLSEAPDVPESKSWDSSLPRMASWVLLSDNTTPSLNSATGQPILFVNTHFDHRGGQARLEAAKVIRQRIAQLRTIANNPHVIVTGDFNTSDDSEPYHALLADPTQLVDTYRGLHPNRQPDQGTFNGFKGQTGGPRIDWILASPEMKLISAEIDRRQFDGRMPSDHYPVTAVLGIESQHK